MSEHIEIRNKVKEIAHVIDFRKMLEETMLSEEDRALLEMHYKDHKDFRYIADSLGYSESTIKRRHGNIIITRPDLAVTY